LHFGGIGIFQKHLSLADLDSRSGIVDVAAVIKKGEEFKILAVGDEIVLVSVALGAAEGETKPDRSGGVDPVDNFFVSKLLGIAAALLIDEGIAVKTRGDELGFSGIGQEIASEL